MNKNSIIFFALILIFSCTKDKVIYAPTELPTGYYDVTCTFPNGNYVRKGVIKITESNSSFLISKNNIYNDTLQLKDKNVSGLIHLPSLGPYIIDGSWSYKQKENEYIVTGNCTEIGYGMGGTVIYYYYGTFEMIKAE